MILGFFSPSFLSATSWSVPINVSPLDQNSLDPRIVGNKSANPFIIWVNAAPHSIVQVTTFSSSPIDLSDASKDAESPRIDVNGSGVGFAIWIESDNHDYVVKVARYDGSSWQSAETLPSKGVPAAPQISINSQGNAVAVWRLFDGTNDTIQGAIYQGSWGAPVTLSSDANAYEPRAKISDAGNAVVVWIEFDGSNDVIKSASYIGSWSVGKTISATGGDADMPQIAIDTSGNAKAIWERINKDFVNVIQVAEYTLLGGWSSPVDISDLSEDSDTSQIALNNLGNAVATWEYFDGTNYLVKASVFTGGKWSTPKVISQSSENIAPARVKMNQAGVAVAVWEANNGSNWVIESNTYSGSWLGVSVLSASGEDANDPDVAVESTTAYAIWKRFDGTNDIVQAAKGTL